MRKLTMTTVLAAGMALPAAAQAQETFYLLSHGGESDAFWIDWNAGAEFGCEVMDVECNISFSGGDMAVQKEALNAAIASEPDGIGTTSAQPGLWMEEVPLAHENGIPIVFFNTDDRQTGRDAYIGTDLREAGRIWANYLVDNGHVEEGDMVAMPVEVPGASYQQLETEGIASVFDPLGIEYEIIDAGTDPAGVINKMGEYFIANDVDAVIALGDTVAASIRRVFDNVGIRPGSIPVVGWGNSKATAEAVRDGYVNAALWQYPWHQGFMTVATLKLAAAGRPIGYDIVTLATYDADTVQPILDIYADK